MRKLNIHPQVGFFGVFAFVVFMVFFGIPWIVTYNFDRMEVDNDQYSDLYERLSPDSYVPLDVRIKAENHLKLYLSDGKLTKIEYRHLSNILLETEKKAKEDKENKVKLFDKYTSQE